MSVLLLQALLHSCAYIHHVNDCRPMYHDPQPTSLAALLYLGTPHGIYTNRLWTVISGFCFHVLGNVNKFNTEATATLISTWEENVIQQKW